LESRRILIIGGTGFLGSNLVEYLVATRPQDEILVFSQSVPKNPLSGKNLSYRQVDVTDKGALAREMAAYSPEYIVNMVGHVRTDRDINICDETIQANTQSVANLLQAASKLKGIRRIVNLSTQEIYGDSKPPFRESDKPQPYSPYSISKYAGECLASFFASRYGAAATNIRLSAVYGPHQSEEKLVAHIITSALAGKPVTLSSPDVELDYVFAPDVARAIDLALGKDVPGGIVNVGGANTAKISEIVAAIGGILGKNVGVTYTNRLRKGDPIRKLSDITLAKKALGWEPATTLKAGLAKTIEWYRKNRKAG